MANQAARAAKAASQKTLAVDIGGSGVKVMVLDEAGKALTERARVETPQPAKPKPVIEAIVQLAKSQGAFDRVSVGFPGVVHQGITYTAVNLDKEWIGVNLQNILEKGLSRPVRVANDADIQGFGVIKGHGVELVLTLGTGVGSGLFVDGKLVPNLELAHHIFRKGKTYEENLGNAALQSVGKQRWNKRLKKAIEHIDKIFNYDHLYLGGGNAKKIEMELPKNAAIVSNVAGLLGGIALWRE